VTLYELLTLEPAFREETREALLRRIVLGEMVPPRRRMPNLPPELDVIIRKSSARDPASRYANAAALADDLRRYRAGYPLKAAAPGLWQRMRRWWNDRSAPVE
jgi:hypothetical protein